MKFENSWLVVEIGFKKSRSDAPPHRIEPRLDPMTFPGEDPDPGSSSAPTQALPAWRARDLVRGAALDRM